MESVAANKMYCVPWVPCYIEEEKFIMKCMFQEMSYTILLSDLKNLYWEELDEDSVLMKSKELNSNMELLPEIIIEQLQKTSESYTEPFHTGSNKLELLKRDSEVIVLKSESLISGVPFTWHYNLKVMKISSYYLYFVQPIISMVTELKRRNEALIKIIKEKDEDKHQVKSSSVSDFNEEAFIAEMDKVMNVTTNTSEIIDCLFCDQLFSKVESALKSLSTQNCTKPKNEPDPKKLCIKEPSSSSKSSFTPADDITVAEEIARRQQLQEQLNLRKQKTIKKKPRKF